MNFNEIGSKLDEQTKEKARACQTPEELFALAKTEGVELSDEELEYIAGGSWKKSPTDDNCQNHNGIPSSECAWF